MQTANCWNFPFKLRSLWLYLLPSLAGACDATSMFNRTLLVRRFQTSCVRHTAVNPKSKRVRKSLADLPKTYILPNGQLATPLGAFVDASKARMFFSFGSRTSLRMFPAERKSRTKSSTPLVESSETATHGAYSWSW